MKKGSLNLIKKMNQRVILKIIHDKEAISRAQISEIADLAPSTVTSIVNELIDFELIKETKKGESRGGRRPILLELNEKGFYVCGFEWGVAEVKSVLMNLNKKVIDKKRVSVESVDLNYFINVTKSMIDSYESQIGDSDKIFGIGLGSHGIVNAEKGILLFAPYFKWENIKLKEIMEKTCNYQFLVDNDVRMMSYVEKWEGSKEFIFIYSGYGIGSAIVLNNQVYHGKDWSAGEFGHMTIVEDGPKCICGSRGCINSLIALPEIVKKYNHELDHQITYGRVQEEWLKIVRNAEMGEEKALKILNSIGKYLGKGISNIINFINPKAIIIGGDFVRAKDIIFPIVKKEIKENALKTSGENIKLSVSNHTDMAGAKGAAAKVMEQIYTLDIY